MANEAHQIDTYYSTCVRIISSTEENHLFTIIDLQMKCNLVRLLFPFNGHIYDNKMLLGNGQTQEISIYGIIRYILLYLAKGENIEMNIGFSLPATFVLLYFSSSS